MTKHEANKYGTLIVKLMRDKLTEEEAVELDEWLVKEEENMYLFECLINEYKQEWARRWFRSAGVSTRGIRWKDVTGWYKPEDKNVWDFYIVMIAVFLYLLLVYYLLD